MGIIAANHFRSRSYYEIGEMIFPLRVFVYIFWSFMAVFSAYASSSETSFSLYQRDLIELNIAAHPLQRQAVEISIRDQRSLSELDEEAFAGIWETRRLAEEHLAHAGNTNRLCYAPLSADKSPTWQIAPYASLPTWLDNCVFRKIYSIWKQAVVLFRTIFPAAQPSRDELERIKTYWSGLETDREIPVREKHGHGPLTEDGVIRKQLVYPASKDEGEVLLLYNYAPLRTGGEQLHFLLIPNPASPAENFLELEQEQYVQVLALAQKVALWARQEFGEHATVHFFRQNRQDRRPNAASLPCASDHRGGQTAGNLGKDCALF